MPPEFNWSPGIGDPSIGGWLTVLLYAGSAFWSYRVAGRTCDTNIAHAEARLWYLLTIGLILLGINKQLDLQSAFTELGRYLAHSQGWYEARGTVQFVFILVMGIASLIVSVAVLVVTLKMPRPTRLAVLGVTFVLLFVVVRAASFHKVDQFIGTEFIGLRWNWILEIGGLLIIQVAAIWRSRLVATSDRRAARSQIL